MSLKHAKSDEFYCESVAKSISEIIRFSLDEEFRRSSFKLFGASCTKETEKEISKRLMSVIESKTTTRKDKTLRKRRKKSEEKDKENLEEPKNTSDAKETNQPFASKVNCESQNDGFQKLPEKFFKENWLEISSKQYRDVVKRRKLNYFSQPQFSQELENTEFSKCDLYFSNSQPTSFISGSWLLFNEKTESSNQMSDNNGKFCQKLFEASFKNNAQKYLKKNSKSFSQTQSLKKTCF